MAIEKSDQAKRQILYQLIFWITLLTLAAVVFSIFLKDRFNIYDRALLSDMVYGEAYKPYVYRILLPIITRILSGVFPDTWIASFNHELIQNRFVVNIFNLLHWDKAFAFEHIIAAFLMYAALVGFVLAFRHLFKCLYDSPAKIADLSALIALIVLPSLFYRMNYLYDFPALLLFTLGLALMLRRQWGLYIFIYILANLNKETAILLTLIYLIYFSRSLFRTKRKLFYELAIVQGLAFIAIRLFLIFHYQGNPGGLVEFHLIDHNFHLLKPFSIPGLMAGGAIILLILKDWNQKPGFLKDGLYILIPLFFMTLLFGFIDELRDYYEAFPIVLLLILPSVFQILDIRIVTKEEKLL